MTNSRKLYDVTSTRGVMIVPPATATSFNSTSTGNDAWSGAVSITVASNTIGTGTAKLKLSELDKGTYTMALGDIYYSDGALSHQSDALLSGKTPIGVVGYIGNNKWTESGTGSGHGGHALVMCLKTIGSTGKTNIGIGYVWGPSGIDLDDTKFPNMTTDAMIKGSYASQVQGSGYTATNNLVALGESYVAATKAKKYNELPAPLNKSTGWFLPTVGQYYAILIGLGGGNFTEGGLYEGLNHMGFFKRNGSYAGITDPINKALAKVGDANYTDFFGSVNTSASTSSEFSATSPIALDSGIDDVTVGYVTGSIRFFGVDPYFKTSLLMVRPFLAF